MVFRRGFGRWRPLRRDPPVASQARSQPLEGLRPQRWRRRLAGAGVITTVVLAVVVSVTLKGGGDRPPGIAPSEVVLPVPANVGAAVTVAAVTTAGLEGLPKAPASAPLPAAPDPGLVEMREGVPLPRVSPDHRLPWQVYARPFDLRDDRPRLVLIVTGFGLSTTASEAALDHLPADVTFAVDAYAQEPEKWAARARARGHEVLATLPLEGRSAAAVDVGPRALRAGAAAAETITALEALLGRCPGCVGGLALHGTAFDDTVPALQPLVATLHSRGLMLVDATDIDDDDNILPLVTAAGRIGLPWVRGDISLDQVASPAAIADRLGRLEQRAFARGVAVGLARPLPVTVRTIGEWWPALKDRHLVLAPASAAANAQLLSAATARP